jgi:hypothetical protein
VTPDLDDAYWRGGSPMLLYFKSDDIGYTSSGDTLEATFKQAKNELFPGRWADVTTVHLDTDATDGITIHLDCSPRLGDSQTRFSTSELRDNGDMPVFASGRYLQPSIVVAAAANWTYMLGIDLEAVPGGRL